MPFIIENTTDIPDFVSDEVFTLSWLIDLYPAATNSQKRFWKARLTVDGVDAPLTNFTYTEDENEIAGRLTVGMRPESRTAVTRDSSIKFETGEKIAGVDTWTTLLDTAKLQASDYALQGSLKKSDSFQIQAMPLLKTRLDETPLGTVVLYDPAKITVLESDFLSIPDITGVENLVTLTSTADLSLYKVFEYVAGVCGFAGYKTNIPDFELTRVDFPPGQPYWSAVAGIIGIFKPILDIDADDELVISDGTTDTLTDTSPARVITVDEIAEAGLSLTADIQRYKGVFLTYQERGTGWDYWTFDIIHDDHYRDNVAGREPLTKAEYWIQKFFRKSFPNTPIKTLTRKNNKWVIFTDEYAAASAEILNYNDAGLLTSREKRVFSRSKAPQSWATFSASLPGPGFDSSFDGPETGFSSASDSTFTTAFVLIRTERETITYLGHPYEADAVYMAYREAEQRGLITRDTENQQLGEDFDQPLMTAQRGGNLAEGQGSYWGTTGFWWEKQTPGPNRQVTISTSQTDSLNTDSGEGLLPADYTDPRVGDIGISTIKALTKEIYITDGGDAEAKRFLPLNGGEAPLSILVPLCVRYNRQQYYPGTVQMTLPGIDLSLKKGRIVEAKNREGDSLGVFRIVGRQLIGQDGKFTTVLNARQIGTTSSVNQNMAVSDSFTIALESGQSRIVTVPIDCDTGRQISGTAVADVTVEARHGSSGSWTNIETTPIALDAWDGSQEDFQFRFTAGTITSPHLVRTFTATIGPA